MAQYINKDALVAEIEKKKIPFKKDIEDGVYPTYLCALMGFEDLINAIETKEVVSIWNDARKTIPEDSSNQIICIKEDDLAVATIGKLVHGTKKWAYLNDLLNISNIETKDVNLEKELKILDNTLFDLDGVAVQGATHYLTVEDCKDIARRFYEMGLNKAKEVEEETISEDLEDAALLHYPKMSRISEPHGFIPADNKSHYLGDANEDNRKAFIVGAQWQKEQDQSTIELAEDHAMLAGMEKMKQEIIDKAMVWLTSNMKWGVVSWDDKEECVRNFKKAMEE